MLSQNTGSFRSVKGVGRPFTVSGPACARIPCAPAGACLCFSVAAGTFRCQVWQGRPQPPVDVAAHGAEPDVRHVQDRVLHLAPHLLDRVQRSGQPGGRNCSSTPSRRPISSLTNFDLCCGAPSVIIRIFPNLSHAAFRNSTNSFPVKVVSLEEPLPVQRDQAEHDGLGVRSRVRVDAADPLGRVDTLPEPRVGYAYRLVLHACRVAGPHHSPLSAAPASCGTTRSSACLLSSRAVPSEPSW